MATGPVIDLNAELRSLLGRVRRRWFQVVALRTAGRAAAAAALPLIAAVLVYLGPWRSGVAMALLAAAPLASACLVLLALERMQRRPDDRHVARFVEERAALSAGGAGIEDAVVSAVEVMEAGPADPRASFQPLVVGHAVRRLRELAPERLIAREDVRRARLEAVLGTALLAVAAWMAAPVLSQSFEAARLRLFPGSVLVDVRPGHARVPVGAPLRIEATVRVGDALATGTVPRIAIHDGDEVRTAAMRLAGDRFEHAVAAVERTVTYEVMAGSARSERYTITALSPPRVKRIQVRYAYPGFTGLKPRTDDDGGDIYAPLGTRVVVTVETDKPAVSGALARTAGAALPLRKGDGGLRGELVLSADDTYRVRLADADGLVSDGETEYFIRLMDDRPPEVRIVRPASDQPVTPLQEVTIEARADDDYGVASLDLVYAIAGRPERSVPFDRVTGTDAQKVGTRLLAVEDLGVKPGDVIAYYARARDVARGKRSSTATSDMFFLEVKPFSEEFVSAQSQAGGAGASSPQIDSLIAAQKEIINATWNIERRTQGGRSAADVQAIARAQAELRARLQQASGGGASNRRPPAPQQVSRGRAAQPAGESHLAAAAEAMARAQQVLEGSRTKDALAHEMAALNALLRAQAEIRRREVRQQQSGSGGGDSGRSGQDLSALFDKELQRQQRTNYANRPQGESRSDRGEADSGAADRVRDLARRQEELNRRQRELAAAGLSVEELKRQLEKLTREQMDLQRQAEELSRQVTSAQRQAGPRGADPQNQAGSQGRGGASGGMRQAAEEMRSAMGQLRREDPKGAAERGARAAEQLRRAEEQMRGAAAGGQPSLLSEAQQIAQEQRRIASEAERLEGAQGAAAADARRRLADEKDRLAGRVENLQRAAERSARSAGTPGQAGAAEAARQLSERRVAQQMRESARGTREGKTGSAATDQTIASALEEVAGTLGRNSSGQSGDLASQLERTRQIRDRLNRLEQQMREARARQSAGRGSTSRQGAPKPGDGTDLQRLEQEYQRELQRAREALAQLGADPRSGAGNATPETEEFSRSAPGTEAFKQDRSRWDSLRKQIDLSMERYEAQVSARATRTGADARTLSAGGSQRTPDGYARMIARYFESLARQKQ